MSQYDPKWINMAQLVPLYVANAQEIEGVGENL